MDEVLKEFEEFARKHGPYPDPKNRVEIGTNYQAVIDILQWRLITLFTEDGIS